MEKDYLASLHRYKKEKTTYGAEKIGSLLVNRATLIIRQNTNQDPVGNELFSYRNLLLYATVKFDKGCCLPLVAPSIKNTGWNKIICAYLRETTLTAVRRVLQHRNFMKKWQVKHLER